MSLTLTLLREDLRNHLGVDSTDLDDTDADRLLNRAWWDLAQEMRWPDRESEYTFITTADDQVYDSLSTNIGSAEDEIQRMIIQDLDTDEWIPLIRIDDWNMFPLRDENNTSFPTHYARRGYEYILHPIPDNAYTIKVKVLRSLQNIQSTGPEAPREWHEVILYGAVARGFRSLGDWNRANAAEETQAFYRVRLSTHEERDKEDSHFSGLRPYRRAYP